MSKQNKPKFTKGSKKRILDHILSCVGCQYILKQHIGDNFIE